MNNNTCWTDVHTHLNMLDLPPKQAVQSAKTAGVLRLITIGTEPEDWGKVIEFSQSFRDVQGALGVHPQSAALYDNHTEKLLQKSLQLKNIIACGEIGLDYYHYEKLPSPPPKTDSAKTLEPLSARLLSRESLIKKQNEVFRRQMELAREAQLPVEIHSRSAESDTLAILHEFRGQVSGLLHCFTGSWSMAKKALDKGFHISFSGIVTFKNAQDLKEVCQKVPLDSLHLETDAPYLAPVPHRGKKNHPAYLIHTAQTVAQLKGISLSELSRHTSKNCETLFKI